MLRREGRGIVFISYARADRARVQPLLDLLKKHFNVWWDREIEPGEPWRATLQHKLDTARCVVVIWTQKSVTRDVVWSECDRATGRGILVPIKLDKNADIPIGFDQLQHVDLTTWKGRSDGATRKLIDRIERLVRKPQVRGTSGPLRESEWTVNDAMQATKDLGRATRELRTIGGILMKGNGPVKGLILSLGEIYATFDAVNSGIETFIAPTRGRGPIDGDAYAAMELGSIEDLIEISSGHCSRITEQYEKIDGIREWLSERLEDDELEEADGIFRSLQDFDFTLFARLESIGGVLTAEAREVSNLIISGQTKLARKRIAEGRQKLLPLQGSVRKAMKELRKAAGKLGYVPEDEAHPA